MKDHFVKYTVIIMLKKSNETCNETFRQRNIYYTVFYFELANQT